VDEISPVIKGTDKAKAITYDKVAAVIELYLTDSLMDDTDCLVSILDVMDPDD
jgi:hypothetical protein